MDLLLQRVFDGLTNGAIYAALALAIAIIIRSTGLLNLAQGEMAMFSTFIALTFAVDLGWPVWLAITITVLLSMAGGAAIERFLIRPVEHRSHLAAIIVTLGLFIFFNGMAGWIWKFDPRGFPSPFPADAGDFVEIGGARLRYESIGIWLTLGAVLLGLTLLLNRTRLGLAFRAVSSNPTTAKLSGARVSQTLMLGWALAAGIGALGATLIASSVFVHPGMMLGVLTYAFAALTIGGFDSPFGAVLGGLIVGIGETLLGGYVGFIGSDMTKVAALVIILAVLLLRPRGLFGSQTLERV
jgi:branched-chain amino acid transport system permease protein